MKTLTGTSLAGMSPTRDGGFNLFCGMVILLCKGYAIRAL